MNKRELSCEICDRPIDVEPLALSALDGSPHVLKVCEACAGSDYVTIEYDGIEVTVHRDDYLRSNRERFWYAIDEAFRRLESHGWTLDAITVQGGSEELNTEPMGRGMD